MIDYDSVEWKQVLQALSYGAVAALVILGVVWLVREFLP